MDMRFREYVDALHPKYIALMNMAPILGGNLPDHIKGSGVYIFTEDGVNQYVGRTRNVQQRYKQHIGQKTTQNNAPFAFKLARVAAGIPRPTYKSDEFTRARLMLNEKFVAEFRAATERIKAMEFRFVNEEDPTRQCLLEVYVSVVAGSTCNDFATT
ncbi:GIY-YIG nuclease family protein [Rhizobium leguminosarum]